MAWNENIKIQREKNSLTQQQLADRLYVSRQTVCRWESGCRCPDLAMTKRIAQIFGITMDELLSEADASGGSESCGFPYPTEILALEKRQTQGKKIQELIQIGAGMAIGTDILIMGAYDMQAPTRICGLMTCVKAILFGAYFMVSRKMRKIA